MSLKLEQGGNNEEMKYIREEQEVRHHGTRGFRMWAVTGSDASSLLLLVPAFCGGWDFLLRGMVILREGESIKEITGKSLYKMFKLDLVEREI